MNKVLDELSREDEDEHSEEYKLQLQKKYLCGWGCKKNNQHHVMEMYKINLVKRFKYFCDDEKLKLRSLCLETKSYFQKL